jgi:ABC-type dipeptide/oligopeptide/nickel transport system ATPase subunit
LRGKDIAMVFQEPMNALNPVMTIGAQIDEAVMLHEPLVRSARRLRDHWQYPTRCATAGRCATSAASSSTGASRR